MSNGDTFTVERKGGVKNIKLKPSLPLRMKWGVAPDVPLTIEVMTAGDSALCGFVMLDTDKHSEMQYGHGQQHGILLKVQKPDRIKIMWSAFPLKKNAQSNKCNDLEKLHHGGVAHATNRG